LAEAPQMPEDLIRNVFDDLQRSKNQLHKDVVSLQARNMELEAYAHIVAHDLKDPLTIIVATSSMITNIPDLTHEELKEYLGQIRTTAYEMNKIINSLLLFAEVNKAEAPLECVNMSWIMTNVGDRLSYMIKEHQAQIALPEFWPDAIGYAPWIEEVWANYLSNALKHGGRPPYVELGASVQPNNMIRFWARDNGPGLATKAQARLFMPFNRISRPAHPGHGLGLSIVLQIVEKLGGQVGVESELGKGSLFYFTLPSAPRSL
jgi:signal transduction histidine kinase